MEDTDNKSTEKDMESIHPDTGDPVNSSFTDLETGKDARISQKAESSSIQLFTNSRLSNREQLTPKPLVFSCPSPHEAFDKEQDELMREIIMYPMVHNSPSIISPVSTGLAKAVRILGMTREESASASSSSPLTPSRPDTPLVNVSNSAGKLSSPQSLRNMASMSMFSGIVWRKSPRDFNFPESDVIEDDTMATPSRSNTLLRRRGRAFKRLSILTSALHPFDPFDGMDAPSQAPSKSEKSSVVGSSDQSSITVTETSAIQEEVVTADFSVLTSTPPPLLEDHPMLRTDPFSVTSDSPLLTTTSTPEEILRCSAQLRKFSVSTENGTSSGDSKKSSVRRRLFNFEGRMTPTSSRSAIFDDALDISPVRPISGRLSNVTRVPSPFLFVEDPADTKRGLRKMSSLFKPRLSADRAVSGSTTPLESPNLDRKDLERYLRVTLASQAYEYSPTDSFPRHPITGRGWKHRNLRCTTCSENGCAVCGRACCAYRACVSALDIHKDNPEGKADAWMKIQEITKVFLYGREASTFLQCTRGGGCGKMVCPDCCGMCPTMICQDLQCRRCKREPWEECEFHRGDGGVAMAKAGRKAHA